MAPRSIWKGAISFGMVAIPIKLYPAAQSKSLSFVTIHNECHTRLKQKRYCPTHDAEVDASEVGNGYEYAKDQYVIMEQSDFESVQVPSTHTIEITRFVDFTSIDPLYFERSYVLEPDSVGEKPFYLLRKALEVTNRVAIAKISLRQKEHICCLRPFENGIVMATMHYPDEIRGNRELNLPEGKGMVSEQEVKMATALIDQLTGPFEPEQYQDGYRLVLEKVIESRLGAAEPLVATPAPAKGKVGDLMEALKASIEATKKEQVERASKKSTPAATRPAARATKKAPVRNKR